MSKKYHIAIIFYCFFLVYVSAQEGARGLKVVKQVEIKSVEGNSGKRYAICIGINGYEHPEIQELSKARNDAVALGEVLKGAGQFDQVFVMTDEIDPRYDEMRLYPRLVNIRDRLKYLEDFIKPEDLVLFSFSGHGISNSAGEGFLLVADTNYNSVFETSFPIADVTDWLKRLKVRKSLLLIDACREKVTETASKGFSKNNLKSAKFDSAEVAAVFYATKSGWYSYEDRNSDFGVFTKYLLQGIKGKADYQLGNRDGIVTFRELSSYVEEAVTNYALELGLKQKPYTKIYGETFGDLALSSYSASINERTRGLQAGRQVKEDPHAIGDLEIYSNVSGQIKIDGSSREQIEEGSSRVIEELPAGNHFVEIVHDYGIYRYEFLIKEDMITHLSNIVILNERELKTMRGVNFVFVKGNAGIADFWISETEISFGQFIDFVNDTDYKSKNQWDKNFRKNYDFYPVHNVSKDDCLAFIEWFSKKTGQRFGLPSVEQWQYAAGKKYNISYPWGSSWNSSYCLNKNAQPGGMLPVVGGRGPIQTQYFLKDITKDGVTSLAGNVREWCADEKTSSEGDVIGIIAGGSWKLSKPRQFHATYTTSKPGYLTAEDLGFRIIILE